MQGQRRGPYEKAQLEEMWKGGQIPVDTLYWHDGMPQWAVISDLFANTKDGTSFAYGRGQRRLDDVSRRIVNADHRM